jgi:hypothetical protein
MKSLILSFPLILCASASLAWWAIWDASEDSPPPPPIPESTKIDGIRQAACEDTDTPFTRFGQTSYMRGFENKDDLPRDIHSRLTGLSIATTAAVAERISTPLLDSDVPGIQVAGRIALARWYLSHDSANTDDFRSRAFDLLREPTLENRADARALRAAEALHRSDWDAVLAESTAALELEPTFYDAQLMNVLAQLRNNLSQNQSCLSKALEMENQFLPILDAGACPTHVAHLDLAIHRYVPFRTSPAPERDNAIQQIILGYVSQNFAACMQAADTLRSGRFATDCAQVINRYDCALAVD